MFLLSETTFKQTQKQLTTTCIYKDWESGIPGLCYWADPRWGSLPASQRFGCCCCSVGWACCWDIRSSGLVRHSVAGWLPRKQALHVCSYLHGRMKQIPRLNRRHGSPAVTLWGGYGAGGNALLGWVRVGPGNCLVFVRLLSNETNAQSAWTWSVAMQLWQSLPLSPPRLDNTVAAISEVFNSFQWEVPPAFICWRNSVSYDNQPDPGCFRAKSMMICMYATICLVSGWGTFTARKLSIQ